MRSVSRTVASLALACAACGGKHPAEVRVISATELGVVVNPRLPNVFRDGGATALVGGKILWMFGDTIFNPAAADGSHLRTNSAARADPSAPLAVDESLDSSGAPLQFIPFTSDESSYNATHSTQRIALWPGAFVPMPGGSSLLIMPKLIVGQAALDYTYLSTELAVIDAAGGVTRGGPLFSAPELDFSHAATRDSNFVYLYSCSTGGDCRAARAPLASAKTRSAYQFWTGNAWDSDVTHSIASIPGSTSGFSIAYNAALGRWLSIVHPGFSSGAELRTAPAPQGPWSDPVQAFHAPGAIYATYLHPELDLDGGLTIRASYYLPLTDFKGELRLMELRLAR